MVVEKNDRIKVEYEGRLESGEVFDSSEKAGAPLEFVVGGGQIIPGFDKGVMGMKEGEEKEITIESADAYGEHRPELKQEIPRDKLPADQEPKEGMMLMVGNAKGQQLPVKVTGVSDSAITVDLNHPLAGQKLIFKIKVVGIEKGVGASEELKKDEVVVESDNPFEEEKNERRAA